MLVELSVREIVPGGTPFFAEMFVWKVTLCPNLEGFLEEASVSVTPYVPTMT